MPDVRTTIRMSDSLYRRAKVRAAASGRTVSEFIEDAVRTALAPRREERSATTALPTYGGSGLMPGVELTDSAALRDRMDEGLDVDAMR
jgi:plasmid stability protein